MRKEMYEISVLSDGGNALVTIKQDSISLDAAKSIAQTLVIAYNRRFKASCTRYKVVSRDVTFIGELEAVA